MIVPLHRHHAGRSVQNDRQAASRNLLVG